MEADLKESSQSGSHLVVRLVAVNYHRIALHRDDRIQWGGGGGDSGHMGMMISVICDLQHVSLVSHLHVLLSPISICRLVSQYSLITAFDLRSETACQTTNG